MDRREYLDIDPRQRRLPPSRLQEADPYKLQMQIARFGRSTAGIPALEVYRGSDGELRISNGVTRATRVAKLLPGTAVRVEVLDDLRTPFGHLPYREGTLAMIDPVRQDVVQALAEMSAAFPEWRLGQMIANLAVVARGATVEAIWDVEDEELLASLHSQLDKRHERATTPA